jgi:outer membrane protein OmpA-like peptidoglycan-associated protein
MSQGLRTKPPAAPSWRLPVALFAAVILVAGCSSSDKPEEAAAPETQPESGSEEFPNLGTVPDQAPESTPKIDREKLLQQLAADRANAEYTDEPLNEETTQLPPAQPPPPSAAAPEAIAGGEETGSAEGAEPPPESAAASLPPPEVAALPLTSGDAAAVIFFEPGSDAMTDRDRAILHDVAVLQRRQQVSRMTIVGHASKAELAESGASELDMALARANAVAAQLMEEGVPSSVIQTATGGGGTYDESGSQGGAPNQRVEILIGQ